MKELDLLPENTDFSVQNGDILRWDAAPAENLSKGSEAFQQGSVRIQFDESGQLSSFLYQINWNEYAATENMISEGEAYAIRKIRGLVRFLLWQNRRKID